jgi:hypothetical protein
VLSGADVNGLLTAMQIIVEHVGDVATFLTVFALKSMIGLVLVNGPGADRRLAWRESWGLLS